jgi:hypothetical protein
VSYLHPGCFARRTAAINIFLRSSHLGGAAARRKIAEKIDQGGRQSGLELLPMLPRITPKCKTDDQSQARVQELISTLLPEGDVEPMR